jgi:uncharacterized protein
MCNQCDKTSFTNHYELAELPYFELRDGGRLCLADPDFGPAMDFHTHLALAYLRPMAVDLQRAPRTTQHYLPMESRLDLDTYQNKNFTPEHFKRMSRDLVRNASKPGGMNATHTIPNILAEMQDLQIKHSVLLAIDLPFISDNAGTWLRATTDNPELVCFGSVHPYVPGMRKQLDRQLAMGARGIKVHPAIQLVRPDWGRCLKLYHRCGKRGLPIMYHCGPVGIEPRAGRYLSQVRHYRRGIEQCRDTTFVLGHSGALQLDLALELAQRNENVYLELASQSLSGIKKILKEGPTDRVLHGSDWPFYHQASALAKTLLATEGEPALRRKVLHDNAARLLGLPLAS